MIIQQLGEGGTIEWMIALGIAWYLTERAVAILKSVHDRRNGTDDIYIDPKTQARMSFPARNLQLMNTLLENECTQTKEVRANGVVLEQIAHTIDERLMPSEELNARLREAVSAECRAER